MRRSLVQSWVRAQMSFLLTASSNYRGSSCLPLRGLKCSLSHVWHSTLKVGAVVLTGLQLIGFWGRKCATDLFPSKGRGPFNVEFCQKYGSFKMFVCFSYFRNCLEKVRSSNSDQDGWKRVVAIALSLSLLTLLANFIGRSLPMGILTTNVKK